MPEIFIVDDSVSVRKALEITLRNHLINSRSAINGEEALKILEEGSNYDLLMIDVIMPGMSGIELCKEVKANPRYAHLPVILMSGNVDDDIRIQATSAGATGVLRKPFKSDELIPLVEGVIADKPKAEVVDSAASDISLPASNEEVAVEVVAETSKDNISNDDLSALSYLLQTYEDNSRVRDVVILDRQGLPIKQTGSVLPENIQLFAKFFTNTAGVLGKQMLGEDISEISIRYGKEHEMIVHNLPAHFVIVLMGDVKTVQA